MYKQEVTQAGKHFMDIMNGSYAQTHFPCKLLLLWGSSVPLYLWQLILAFQFGKGVSIGAGIISGLISALMLTGLGDYVWKYVFVCWTGRVPYTYLQSVLGETSVGEWLSFIPGCLIFTGISMVYYFWWVNHWEGNRISE